MILVRSKTIRFAEFCSLKYLMPLAAKNKKHREMMSLLMETAADFRTVPVDSPMTFPSEELCSEIKEMGGKAIAFPAVDSAVEDALISCGDNELIVSLGSLYNAGEIRNVMQKRLTR